MKTQFATIQKILSMLIFSLVTVSSYCQQQEKKIIVNGVNINELAEVRYIQVLGVINEQNKLTIELDYGQKLGSEQVITGGDGKPQSFESMMGALNFLNKNGWEFINAYEAKSRDGNVYYFILKRQGQ